MGARGLPRARGLAAFARLPAFAVLALPRALGVLALLFAAAAPVLADVPLSPGDHGDCGAPGLVCHKGRGDGPSVGICRASRSGEVFCDTSEASARSAAAIEAARAERSRRESTWVLGGGAAVLAALATMVVLLRRRHRAQLPPRE